jgi:hypothetical protein
LPLITNKKIEFFILYIGNMSSSGKSSGASGSSNSRGGSNGRSNGGSNGGSAANPTGNDRGMLNSCTTCNWAPSISYSRHGYTFNYYMSQDTDSDDD